MHKGWRGLLSVWAFLECSLSSVLYPLALFDKIKVSDLVDFLIKQVLKQMLRPPSLEAMGAGTQELSLLPGHQEKGQGQAALKCPRWSELASLCPQPQAHPLLWPWALEFHLRASPPEYQPT